MTTQFKNQVSNEVLSTIDALKSNAIEDVNVLKSHGALGIINTDYGFMHLKFEKNLFSVKIFCPVDGEIDLLKNASEIEMITFLMCNYKI
tara:strand:- start:466 stop:735 length:270 start_codon:yes stop_codon:yes gene_type:complete